MRFEILVPQEEAARAADVLDVPSQALAKPKPWRWQIVDEKGQVLATSPELKSREDCDNAIRQIRAAFEQEGSGAPVEVPAGP